MHLQTDPEVIEKLAEERQEENWQFRCFLNVYERLKVELWHPPVEEWEDGFDAKDLFDDE